MKTTIKSVADYFIYQANKTGSLLSNLKLQKLLYYAQAWHLASEDKPLFSGKFQAWVHGPVHVKTYHAFKSYGYRPINHEVDTPNVSPGVAIFLDKILDTFMPHDGWVLEQMTHREAPWLEARNNLPPDACCNEPLNEDTMKSYYRNLLENAQK